MPGSSEVKSSPPTLNIQSSSRHYQIENLFVLINNEMNKIDHSHQTCLHFWVPRCRTNLSLLDHCMEADAVTWFSQGISSMTYIKLAASTPQELWEEQLTPVHTTVKPGPRLIEKAKGLSSYTLPLSLLCPSCDQIQALMPCQKVRSDLIYKRQRWAFSR